MLPLSAGREAGSGKIGGAEWGEQISLCTNQD